MLDKDGGTEYNYDNSGRTTKIGGRLVSYDEKNRLYMRDVSTPFGVVNSSIFYAGELLYPDEPDRVLGSGAGHYTENYNLDSQKRVSRIDMDMTSAVSSPTKTCSLKREITYNDSDADAFHKLGGVLLVPFLCVAVVVRYLAFQTASLCRAARGGCQFHVYSVYAAQTVVTIILRISA